MDPIWLRRRPRWSEVEARPRGAWGGRIHGDPGRIPPRLEAEARGAAKCGGRNRSAGALTPSPERRRLSESEVDYLFIHTEPCPNNRRRPTTYILCRTNNPCPTVDLEVGIQTCKAWLFHPNNGCDEQKHLRPGLHLRRRLRVQLPLPVRLAVSGSGHGSSNQRRRTEQDRPGGGKKGGGAGSDRDARWAEQLLGPCTVAVEACNLSRVQHLFYVLGELAAFSDDANHRLVARRARALSPPARWLAPAVRVPPHAIARRRCRRGATAVPRPSSSSTSPSPHGRTAPPSVRRSGHPPVSFSARLGTTSPHLLRCGKSIKPDLDIGAASLDSRRLRTAPTRRRGVPPIPGHVTAEERTDIIRRVKDLKPQLVVLSELDVGGNDSAAAGEFTARLELLWRFLESTHAAFKGRDGEDRRLLEAEAGTAVACTARRPWARVADRMTAAGFDQVAFGAAVESARSLRGSTTTGGRCPRRRRRRRGGAAMERAAVSFCWRPA
ncbi:hypothetical protein ZWY2020_036244 [Hordeum vulgare]|nr:hypothetical protein ZWY2020_036244 [Hordeum vulgare]